MKAKVFPSDKLLHDEFSVLSAQIEIKLLIKNDEFKIYIKTTEMKKMMESSSFNPLPCDEKDKKKVNKIC